MLKNHCQPCGDQGVLCHATLPHGLIPPIKRSRVPGHGYGNYSVFIIIKVVAAERVAECGGLLLKKWPVFAKIG